MSQPALKTSTIDPTVAGFLNGAAKKLLIGGQWVEAQSGKTFESVNPATGEVLARVAEADAADVTTEESAA